MVFGKVSEEVSIPKCLAIVKVQLPDTVASDVRKCCLRTKHNFPTSIVKSPAEIYVLEPDGEEALIETADVLPCFFHDGETSAGRLLNFLNLRVIQIQAAILTIDGIIGPQTVQKHYLRQRAG